jgi:hypothetical protein
MDAAPPFSAPLRHFQAHIDRLRAGVGHLPHLRAVLLAYFGPVAPKLRQHCVRRCAPPIRIQRRVVRVERGVLRQQATKRLRIAALDQDRLR